MENSYRFFEKYIESNGKMMKECTDCTFPHKAENYEVIIGFLSNN